MRRRVLIAALLAAPLAGCSRVALVEVSGTGTAPVFSLRTPGTFRKPPLPFPGRLRVYEVMPDRTWRSVWSVTAPRASDLPADARLTYGQAPRLATADASDAEPLRAGGVYEVQVSGMGYRGSALFAVDRDGRLVAGRGDEAAEDLLRRMSTLAPQNGGR